MNRLLEELNKDEKLSKSNFANEVLNLIKHNAETDQELSDAIEENKIKTLTGFGKYVHFVAKKKAQDGSYAMGMSEMSENIKAYFTGIGMDQDWVTANMSEEEKQKLIQDALDLNLSTASEEELKGAIDALKIDFKAVPEEEQDGLVKETIKQQMVSAINLFKVNQDKKIAKEESKDAASEEKKEEVKEEVSQQSIFDMG